MAENEYERLVNNLVSNKLTIRHIESAYREYLRRRKDIPEGARILLAADGQGGLIRFAKDVLSTVGAVELSYLRGRQEGATVEEKDYDGGLDKRNKCAG